MSDNVRLRVVRGEPTPEELAALVVVLTGRPARPQRVQRPRAAAPSAWTDRSYGLRRPLAPGPGAWRAAAWSR